MVLGVALAITALSYSVSWMIVIRDRQPPVQLPSPPQKPLSITGVEVGAGFHAADPILLVQGGEEYKYLESTTDPSWEPVAEVSMIREDDCERNFSRKIEDQAGEITQCVKATTFGEWCPSPIYYYALSADGNLWMYRKDFPCSTINLPISFLIGLLVGVSVTVFFFSKRMIKKRTSRVSN